MWLCVALSVAQPTQAGVIGAATNACDPATQSCAAGTPIAAPGPAMCGPAAGGVTVCGAGPATLGNQSGSNQGAGNPINAINGNKYQREEDLPALPGVLGLEIVRHYNSAYSTPGTTPGILGRGWKLSYETDLYSIGDTLQIVQADGTRVIFNRDPANRSLCSTADPANGRLRIASGSRGNVFIWTWTNGRELRFDSDGKLVQIAAPTGEFVSLLRDPRGVLLQVTDPQGRQLRLQYPGRTDAGRRQFHGVASITSPVGVFAYHYGSAVPATAVEGATGESTAATPPLAHNVLANLVAVTYPDQRSGRLYHYEDARRPTFLSGISSTRSEAGKTDNKRIATYLYDINGRAVLSVRGMPARLQTGADGQPVQPARLIDGTGIGQVHLDYTLPGVTVLTNSLGQKTTYRHAIVASQYRLLEVRGAGCSQCGEVNVRYGYDKLGRQTEVTRLDEAGLPIQGVATQRDAIGRPLALSRIPYQAGQAGHPEVQLRYAYLAGSTAATPTLIARPSVIPGRQHEMRIDYNDSGQPLQITETGYTPAFANAQVDPDHAPSNTRVTAYRYRTINGRSLLTQIDGPLKNGTAGTPGDSDITRLEWSRDGAMIEKITQPANRTTRFDYEKDGARRLAKTTGADGVITQLQYDFSGALTQLRRGDAITRYEHHGSEAGTQILAPDGQTMQIAFNGLHDVTTISDRQNNRIELQRDTEGALVAARLRDPDGTLAQDTTLYQPQQSGKRTPRDSVLAGIQQVIASTGAADGEASVSAESIASPYRVLRSFMAAATAAIDTEPRRAVTQANDSSGRPTTWVTDDFGNLVAVHSPATGTTTYHYDTAGRIAGQAHPDGSHADYTRDAAGRVIAMRATSARNTLDENASITWGAADKPVRITYMAGEERFAYDAANRLIAHEQTVDGQRYTLQYRYDSAGRMTGKTLPDGQTLRYRYRDAAHPRAGLLESVWLEGFASDTANTLTGGMLDRPIVQDMNDAGDRYARRTLRFGNGLPNALLLDRQGRVVSAGNAEVGQTQLQYASASAASAASAASDMAYPSSVRTVHTVQPGQRALTYTDATIAQALRGRIQRVSASWGESGDDPETAPSPLAGLLPDANAPSFDEHDRQISRGAIRFTYDSLNRLTGVDRTIDGGVEPVARYRYNLFGQRIAKTVALTAGATTRTTHYFYDGSVLAFEGQAPTQPQRQADGTREASAGSKQPAVVRQAIRQDASQYIWLNDKPVALLRRGQLYAIHTDHRNAPLAVTDAAREVVWQANVADYLQTSPANGSRFGNMAFNLRGSNQYFDAESGLHYNTRRYYDPAARRYLTPDPLGLAVGADLHAFALNRPQTMADPLGLAPAAATTDWSKASYDDKFVEIVRRTAPLVPGEIGAALLEMVQPENLAAMSVVFAVWAVTQGTPAGVVVDVIILGASLYLLGSGTVDFVQAIMALHNGAKTAKCDPDLTAAAAIVANKLVSSASKVGGAGAGAGGAVRSGGLTRIGNAVRDIIAYAKKRGGAGGKVPPVPPGGTGNGTDRVVLDLFGGRTSQIPGAINVDIAASQGVRASATQLPFRASIADEIIASNPFIPGGNGMMDFLPGAVEVLKPGGQLIVNATQRNPFGVLPDAQTLEGLGLRVIQQNGPLLPRFENNVFRLTDGRIIPNTSVRTTILEKIK